MTAILLEGYIDIPTDRLPNAQDFIPVHIETLRGKPGCLFFEVKPCHEIENRFLLFAKFQDQCAVDVHIKESFGTQWGKLTRGIPRIYEVSYVNQP